MEFATLFGVMRTRIFVTVLAVCGVLIFLFWRPSVETRSPVVPAAVEEGEAVSPTNLESVSEEAVSESRVEVVPDEPKPDAPSRVKKVRTSRGEAEADREADPIEGGACTLFLKLVDVNAGAPQAGRVDLWRLNAPGNDNWSVGDQLQATEFVLQAGHEFEDLPPGTYRARSMGAVANAGYADAFQVGGAFTEHTLLVDAPREIETFVEIYYASGVRVEEIEVKGPSRSWQVRHPGPPAWRVERISSHGISISMSGGGGGFGHRSHQSWRKLQAGPRGFALGSFLQNSRERLNRYQFDLRVADGGEVDLEIDSLPEPGGHLVAVFMSEQEVLQHIVLADGSNGAVAEVSTMVKAHPVPVDEAHPHATWRDASIEVTVFQDDHGSWNRVWRPSEGPMTDRWISNDE